MTDDAYLFFRNLRQTYYHIEEMPEAGIRIYRHKNLPSYDTAAAMIDVGIMVNWKMSKAYILVQPSPILGDSVTLFLEKYENEKPKSLVLKERNQHKQLLFSADLFDAINSGVQLQLVDTAGSKTPFLAEEKERDAMRITLKDFYKLTGLR